MNKRQYQLKQRPGTDPHGGNPPSSGPPHREIQKKVTERILELLEQGVKPWAPSHYLRVGFPRNFGTGRFYQGINVFLLGMQRYASPYWLTYKQATELGGFVRKGEKSSMVVKFGTTPKGDEDDANETGGGNRAARPRGFLKLYSVFNATQIQGIDFPQPEDHPERRKPGPGDDFGLEPLDAAEKIVREMPLPPFIDIGRHAIACYEPQNDTIRMPPRTTFRSDTAYYSTLFHELAHATGHRTRLARATLMDAWKPAGTGSETPGVRARNYGKEELVAEMAASFLCAHAGFEEEELEDAASYLQGWLQVLKAEDHQHWIISAASQAQRASDFILCRLGSRGNGAYPQTDPGHPEYLPANQPEKAGRSQAAGNVHMRTYVRPPYWLKARFSSTCTRCGGQIQQGDDIFYVPDGKKTFCNAEECGGEESRKTPPSTGGRESGTRRRRHQEGGGEDVADIGL